MINRRIKLAIDARPLTRNSGGMTRYLAELIAFICDEKKFDITLYTDQPIHNSLLRKDVKVRSISRFKIAKLFWFIVLPIWIRLDKVDLFWSPRHHLPFLIPKKTKTVVTIHDFVWKRFPYTMPTLQRLSERVLMPIALRKTDGIICISETTQIQLNSYFGAIDAKSCVIKHGIRNKIINPIDTKTRGNFILAVGTIEPRKNYINLIKGFERYAESGTWNLVIVGKQGWLANDFWQAYESSKYRDRVTIKQSVNDDELANLYNTAAGFISPSLDEGYGLPAQEASFFGLPLLLANIPVYKELYGYSFGWFEANSATDIAKAITNLEKNKSCHYQVTFNQQTTWQECAKNHIEFLAQFN